MSEGFPLRLLPLVVCPEDGGRLDPRGGDRSNGFMLDGSVACATCGTELAVRDGILDALDLAAIADERSRFELRSRDDEATQLVAHASERDTLEAPSTLRALGELGGETVLEIGCGTGKYTRILAGRCAALVAIDFSWESLLVNARGLHAAERPQATVAFVRADVGQMRLRAGAFDAALSTLYSNLPSPELRSRCNRHVHEALRPGGRYVVSCHHQDFRRRRAGRPAKDRYSTGVFAEHFTKASFRGELAMHFDRIEVSGISTHLPLVSRIRLTRPLVSRIAERMPLLDELAAILLAVAIKV